MIKNIFRSAFLLSFILSSTSFASVHTLPGLQSYVAKYHNRVIPLTGKLDGKFLQVDFDFLEPKMEAKLEGEDLFIHNWKKNQRTMEKLAKTTGIADFAHKEGFIAVSIGSSSTQAYHFQNGRVETFNWFLGTDNFGAGDSFAARFQLQYMLHELGTAKKAGTGVSKPIVFMNSIAFADVIGVNLTGFDAISLASFGEKPKFGSNNKKNAGTNVLANGIVEFLQNNWNINHAFLLKTKNKADKILNKWTNALVQRLFAPKEFGFVGDMGGSGYSLKFVEYLAFEDTYDYIKKYNDGNDSYLTPQDDIVSHFETNPLANNAALDEAIERLINTAINGLEIEFYSSNNPDLKSQKVFKLVIRQSGKLRKLFLDNGGSFRVIPEFNLAAAVPQVAAP